jgi:hypothetical protein
MEAQNRRWQLLAKETKKQDFSSLGNLRKKPSIKNIIKNCAQESFIKNILLKHSCKNGKYLVEQSVSIKFLFPKEKMAYDFLDKFYQKANGIIVCDLIRIIKTEKMKFEAKMDFRIFTIPKESKSFTIKTPTKKYQQQKSVLHDINMFSPDESPTRYTLLCIIDNSRAYVNDRWVKKGDTIDNFSINYIRKNSIDLKGNKKTLNNIKIGASWLSTNL